jgi:hypothetical protein
LVEKETGKILSAQEVENNNANQFSFDAFRTLWRVGLDAQWFHSVNAYNYLQEAGYFVKSYYNQNKSLPMIVKSNGEIINHKPSIAINAGYLAIFMFAGNEELLKNFYQSQIQAHYNSSGKFWQNKNDYYGNNWAWFATALYNGNLTKIKN